MKYEKLNKSSIDKFIRVIDQLTPDSQRQWGSLTPVNALAHLSTTLLVSLNRVNMKDEGNFITKSALFRKLIFEYMPWPKGKIKAPDDMTPQAEGDFDAEKERLIGLMK